MKENTHPKYFESQVTCGGCGNTFTIGSTVPEIRLNVCGKCHPFFTGRQKFLDTEGRIDKFKAKFKDYQSKLAPKA